jgi:hypothetical protein
MSSEINKVLTERGANYGDFAFVAFRSQQIQNHLRVRDPEKQYTPTQREALQMIASKLARIVTGNPGYRDSWIDIAGYAQLVADSIEKSEPKNDNWE